MSGFRGNVMNDNQKQGQKKTVSDFLTVADKGQPLQKPGCEMEFDDFDSPKPRPVPKPDTRL